MEGELRTYFKSLAQYNGYVTQMEGPSGSQRTAARDHLSQIRSPLAIHQVCAYGKLLFKYSSSLIFSTKNTYSQFNS